MLTLARAATKKTRSTLMPPTRQWSLYSSLQISVILTGLVEMDNGVFVVFDAASFAAKCFNTWNTWISITYERSNPHRLAF